MLVSLIISLIVVVGVVAGILGGSVDSASAKSDIKDDELRFDVVPAVTDRVDRDGDGRLSSFKIRWTADTMIQDGTVGKRDIPPDHPPWISEGHPKFALFGIVPQENEWKRALLGIKEVGNEEDNRIEMEVTLRDKKFERPPQGNSMVQENGMEGFALVYVESDSSPDSLVFKDVDTMNAVVEGTFGAGKAVGGVVLVATGAGAKAGTNLIESSKDNFIAVGESIKKSWSSDDHIQTETKKLEEPIKLEKPSQDRSEQLEVTANVDGATVKIDGEEVGQTPWTDQYPVDHAERNGPATITVDAEGYGSEARSVEIEPQQTERCELERLEKPLVINATPSDSEIYIDGSYAGQPPVERTMWVEDSVDVWVNHSDRINENFEDVSPPRTIDASLFDTDRHLPGGGVGGVGPIRVDPIFDNDFYGDLGILEGAFWADFSHAPETVTTGDTVSFDGTQSTSLSGNITRYEWDFGDGSTASGSQPSHTYTSPGTYTVDLTVTNDLGNTTETDETVTVTNAPPDAGFVASSLNVETGETVELDGSPTTDVEDSIRTFSWDLDGDGSTEMTGQKVTHTYANPGTYTLEMEVTDSGGNTESATKTLTAKEPNTPPNPSISTETTTPSTDESVTFDASGSTDPDGTIRSFSWEFGDGTQTNGAAVSHTYERPGAYDVKLLVVDDGNDLASTDTTIQVQGEGETSSEAEQQTQQDETDGSSADGDGDRDTDSGGSSSTGEETESTDQPPESEEAGDGPEQTDDTEGMPGFGAVVTVVALAVFMIVVARRRKR
jgi:PGF-CTERM protein